ncbi:RAP protein [Plasmodium gonderi]|uniref:RAP protein n=1 Tax=Plasmodium gonderi TaxID=77519 RepID=A0A1Y1JE53_PLAGO|nr:RAP protein [Plasmodium gonderi]GAW79948.1 RAP protein [Plasmodium gonderi]
MLHFSVDRIKGANLLTRLFAIPRWQNKTVCGKCDIVPPDGEKGKKMVSLDTCMENISKNKLLYLMKNMEMIHLTEKEILNTVSNLLKKYTDELTTDEMGFVIHTFCKLKFIKYSLCNNFVKIIMNNKPKFSSMRILTQFLIDLHKMGSLDFNVLTFFTQYYIRHSLSFFSLFDLSMILYIYNKHNYNDVKTIHAICNVIHSYFMQIVQQDKGVLTTILLSLSALNLNYDMFMKLLNEHVYKKYNQFEVKYLCNIAYCIALWLAGNSAELNLAKGKSQSILSSPQNDFLIGMLSEVTRLLLKSVNKMKNEELKQIHIVLYLLKDVGKEYEEAIQNLENKKIKSTLTVSKMQKQMEKIFKEIGLRAEQEFPIGPYVLDFAFRKKMACIEVNGFTHYYTFGGGLNAKSKLKYYILRKLNWKVLTVEYMDWKNKSKEDKVKYLEKNILERIK